MNRGRDAASVFNTFLACVGALCAGLAFAPEGHCADLQASLAHQQSSYLAQEHFDSGQLANEERGVLHAWFAAARAQADDNVYSIEAIRQAGALAYAGRTQIGIPIGTRTDLVLTDVRVVYERILARGPSWEAGAGLAVGQRRIERAIAPTVWSTALDETLRWRYWRMQAQASHALGGAFTMTGRVFVERGQSAALDVDFHGMGDSVTVHPCAATGYGAQADLRWRLAPQVSLGLALATERQDYGASPYVTYSQGGAPVGLVRYPGSRQTLNSARVHLDIDWP